MISKKYFHYIFVAIMAMGMTFVMSLVSMVNNEAQSAQFVMMWLKSTVVGFCFAYPTALAVTPIAKWTTEKLTAID